MNNLDIKQLQQLILRFDTEILSNPEEILLKKSEVQLIETMSRGTLYTIFRINNGTSKERDQQLEAKLFRNVHLPAISTRISIDLLKGIQSISSELIKDEMLKIAELEEQKLSGLKETLIKEEAKPVIRKKIDEFVLDLFNRLENMSEDDKAYYAAYFNYHYHFIFAKFVRFCYTNYRNG